MNLGISLHINYRNDTKNRFVIRGMCDYVCARVCMLCDEYIQYTETFQIGYEKEQKIFT